MPPYPCIQIVRIESQAGTNSKHHVASLTRGLARAEGAAAVAGAVGHHVVVVGDGRPLVERYLDAGGPDGFGLAAEGGLEYRAW